MDEDLPVQKESGTMVYYGSKLIALKKKNKSPNTIRGEDSILACRLGRLATLWSPGPRSPLDIAGPAVSLSSNTLIDLFI